MDYEICNICGAQRSVKNLNEDGSCRDIKDCLYNVRSVLNGRLLEQGKIIHAMAEMMFSPSSAVHTRREAELVIREWMNKED